MYTSAVCPLKQFSETNKQQNKCFLMIHLELTLKITLYLCLVFPHLEENSIKTKPKRKKQISHFRKAWVEVIMVIRSSTHGKCSDKGGGFWFILMLRWHKTWLGFTAPEPASPTTSDKPLKTRFLPVFGQVKIQRSTYQSAHIPLQWYNKDKNSLSIPLQALHNQMWSRKGRALTSFQRWGASSPHSSALHFTYSCAISVKIAVLFESLWAGSWPELAKRKYWVRGDLKVLSSFLMRGRDRHWCLLSGHQWPDPGEWHGTVSGGVE